MGTITVFGQLTTFVLALLFGVAYSLLYDIFKTFHLKIFKGFWSVFISDILYWFILLVCTYSFLLIFCNGIVRAYVLFGNVVGFALCRFTLSKIFIKICFLTIFIIEKIIQYIKLPIGMLCRFMSKLYEKAVEFSKKIVKKLFKKRKKHLERDDVNGV